MEKIKLSKVIKYYGDRKILDIDNLIIYQNEKIGIVGTNGSGKSTLLNVIVKATNIDEGKIDVNGKIAYIKQFEEMEEDYNLSGGEKQKSIIYSKLNENKDIILADEPSSNLDIKNIEDLKRKLKEYNGTLLLISHDRNLLDEVCNVILEIENGKIKKYKGNYSFYKRQKEKEEKRKQIEYNQFAQEKKRLEKSLQITEYSAKTMKKTPSRMGNSEARLHKRETSDIRKKLEGHSKAIQSRIDMLEEKEKPNRKYDIRMKIKEENYIKAAYIVNCDKLSVKLENKELFKDAKFNIKANKVTVLIGNNGIGKTTLISKIINKCENIKINPQAKIAYFSQNIDELDFQKTILQNIMDDSLQDETIIRIVLGNLFIQNDDVYKKVEILSGGEKVKVAIAKILLSDSNFIILDEPTNFLDVNSIEALEKLIKEYKGTILLVTHDIKLIDNVAQNIMLIENKKVIEFEGNYTKYLEYKEKNINQSNSINSSEKLLLEFKLSTLNSQISVINDKNEKEKLLKEYNELFEKYKQIL